MKTTFDPSIWMLLEKGGALYGNANSTSTPAQAAPASPAQDDVVTLDKNIDCAKHEIINIRDRMTEMADEIASKRGDLDKARQIYQDDTRMEGSAGLQKKILIAGAVTAFAGVAGALMMAPFYALPCGAVGVLLAVSAMTAHAKQSFYKSRSEWCKTGVDQLGSAQLRREDRMTELRAQLGKKENDLQNFIMEKKIKKENWATLIEPKENRKYGANPVDDLGDAISIGGITLKKGGKSVNYKLIA